MAEEILIRIDLEKGDNEKEVDQLTKKITDLTAANADLNKQNKELIKTGKENSKEYLENTRQIEINKQKINESAASRKNLITQIIAEDTSIKGLRARNAELIKQRDQLSTSTEEGRQKIAELNQQIDNNNETIKQNSSELEKQKINIGNYRSALEGIVPGLSGLTGGIENATVAARTFIATPLGLILAGIALALAPVVSFLSSTGDGMDLIEKKTTGLKAGLSVLKDEVNDLGRQVVEGDGAFGSITHTIVKLNPLVALFNVTVKATRELMPGLAKDFDEATAAGERYAEAMDEINTEQAFFETAAKAEENAIKELILQSKNRTKTEEERIALIDQATVKEKALTDSRLQFAIRAAEQEVQFANTRANLVRAEGETLEDFGARVARVIDSIGTEEERDRVLNAIAAIEEARSGSIAIEEKLQNQRDALADKAEQEEEKRDTERLARKQKINDAIFALEEIRLQREISGAGSIDERVQKEIELEDARVKHLLDNDKLLAEEREVIEQQHQDTITEIKLAAEEERAEIEARRVEALNKQKELEIQQEIINAESIQARVDKEIELETLKAAILLENTTLLEEERQLILETSQAKINQIITKGNNDQLAANKKLSDANKKLAEDERKAKEATINAGMGLLKEVFGEYREFAAAEALISAYRAASAALEPPPIGAGPLFGPILAGLTLARGLAQAANIARLEFANGGLVEDIKGFFGGGKTLSATRIMSKHGVPIHRANGDNRLATVKTGEVILNERQQAALGGSETFRRIGVPGFAGGGGFLTNSQTSQAATLAQGQSAFQDSVRTIMREFPPIVVTVEDINAKQEDVATTQNRAQVI